MQEAPLLVLGKITAILDAFSLRNDSLTGAEIRRATGIPASTAHRLLANLVAEGFLDRTDDRYSIGARMAYWAAPAVRRLDIVDLLSPALTELRDETEETAVFFRVEQRQRVCIGLVETRHELRREMRLGRVMPLHVGSTGRVLLAWTPGLLDDVLAEPLEPLTPDTIVDAESLRRVVDATRAQGFAITTGERESAASGIAAPVFDRRAELVGAISVQGPTLRLTEARLTELIDPVVGAADRLTQALAGRAPRGLGRRLPLPVCTNDYGSDARGRQTESLRRPVAVKPMPAAKMPPNER
jgi:DNA-binding IclR family transcriptional regulator